MSTSTNTSPASNPHFGHIDRAPYELGHLLQELPDYFSTFTPMTPEVLLKATAAAGHAHNANDTLMHGLEALGKMMFVAGANEQHELGVGTLSDLGCLIQHIAVEAQFLQETASCMDYAVRRQNGGEV